jgi:hypothetical protein
LPYLDRGLFADLKTECKTLTREILTDSEVRKEIINGLKAASALINRSLSLLSLSIELQQPGIKKKALQTIA